jgi:hypothetical protein
LLLNFEPKREGDERGGGEEGRRGGGEERRGGGEEVRRGGAGGGGGGEGKRGHTKGKVAGRAGSSIFLSFNLGPGYLNQKFRGVK